MAVFLKLQLFSHALFYCNFILFFYKFHWQFKMICLVRSTNIRLKLNKGRRYEKVFEKKLFAIVIWNQTVSYREWFKIVLKRMIQIWTKADLRLIKFKRKERTQPEDKCFEYILIFSTNEWYCSESLVRILANINKQSFYSKSVFLNTLVSILYYLPSSVDYREYII